MERINTLRIENRRARSFLVTYDIEVEYDANVGNLAYEEGHSEGLKLLCEAASQVLIGDKFLLSSLTIRVDSHRYPPTSCPTLLCVMQSSGRVVSHAMPQVSLDYLFGGINLTTFILLH
jgi:hypothetical protein